MKHSEITVELAISIAWTALKYYYMMDCLNFSAISNTYFFQPLAAAMPVSAIAPMSGLPALPGIPGLTVSTNSSGTNNRQMAMNMKDKLVVSA